MENKMVLVKNNYDSQVGVVDPFTSLKLRWMKRGQSLPIAFDTLKQLVYQDGFKRMLEQGILYIEDMEIKKALALEPDEATKPTNLISLSELEIKNLLTKAPIDVFKRELSRLPDTQIDSIIDYAIKNEIVNVEKCKVLKDITHRDIMVAISNIQNMEDLEKKEAAKR